MKIVSWEFSELVKNLLNQLKPVNCVEPEEYRLAKKLGALPLGYDLTAFVFLKLDGEVIWFDFIDNEFGSSRDLQGLIRAIVSGVKRYPQFENFIPERPEKALIYVACQGTKLWGKDIFNEQPARCVFCAGLGWIISEDLK